MNMEEAYQDFKDNHGQSTINPYRLWVAACTWSTSSKKRSTLQNALYWRRINEISEQAFLNKQQFSAFSWHIYFKQKIMQIEFEDKTGKVITKYIQLPDGSTALKSTSVMSKKEFSDYITKCEAYATQELGVKFSEDYESN
jgi:hypothetical protein|tara:strand:+ start:1892 stop:2314 length:423 start_codon:yes stop_codon:yes gene_type:complete